MYTESGMASSHLILCCPLLLLCQFSPASESFLLSWLFASGSQSIGASALALPMNTQDWFPLGWLIWSVCYPRDSQESSPEPQFKASVLWHSAFFMVQPSRPYMITVKTIALATRTFRYLLSDKWPFIHCRYLLSHCFVLSGNSLCQHNLWLAKCRRIAQIPEMSLKWYAYWSLKQGDTF